MSGDREPPGDFVARLPRRTAHAVYALAQTARAGHCSGPFCADEVLLYDHEAPSARSTATALRHALSLGLADRVAHLWWATNRANSLFWRLEARVLKDRKETSHDTW